MSIGPARSLLCRAFAMACMVLPAAGRAVPTPPSATVMVSGGRANAAGDTPLFAVIRRSPSAALRSLTTVPLVPNFVFPFANAGKTYHPRFVGLAVTSNRTTTVPVTLVPVRLSYTASGKTTVMDPTVVTDHGVTTVVQNVLASPVFRQSITYVQGGTNLGTTQYADAYQRANLWRLVKTYPNYHTLLSTPTVTAVQTVAVPTTKGKLTTSFKTLVIQPSLDWFDTQLQGLATSLRIPRNVLPVFITTQVYLGNNADGSGCCVGGFHSVLPNGQPYVHATYITTAGAFAQDVSALSHEIGEWMDDPTTANPVPAACGVGAVLENGDPLENNANFGNTAYTVSGVTWHLQDLVMLPYFGAPAVTSLHGWSTFQNYKIAFCSAGQ